MKPQIPIKSLGVQNVHLGRPRRKKMAREKSKKFRKILSLGKILLYNFVHFWPFLFALSGPFLTKTFLDGGKDLMGGGGLPQIAASEGVCVCVSVCVLSLCVCVCLSAFACVCVCVC